MTKTLEKHPQIASAKAAFELLKKNFNPSVEEFWGVYLTHHLELKSYSMICRGTLNYCKVHPRDLFREAIAANSFAIIIAHNHIGNHLEPSMQDLRFTQKIKKSSLILEIPILDHLIFSDSAYYSFKENNLL